jgi:hypothetical protein
MPNKKCQVCNKVFYSKPNNGKRGKYCSRECYNEDKKSNRKEIKCANCKKVFKRPMWRFNTKPMKHYFCGLKCYGKYRSNHFDQYPQYNRRNKIVVAKDLDEETLKKEYNENRLKIREIAEKYNCAYTTVNARMRKYKIKTDRGRYSKGNSEDYWRKYMNKKYKKCKVCGWCEDVCDVAHKESRKRGGKYKEENLILLCPNCHRLYDKGKLKI